jgi:hypothetical protein
VTAIQLPLFSPAPPSTATAPRIWAHVDCGGWVLFSLAGGFCGECRSGPLTPEQYAKPTAGAA